jgi:hypothetical protein
VGGEVLRAGFTRERRGCCQSNALRVEGREGARVLVRSREDPSEEWEARCAEKSKYARRRYTGEGTLCDTLGRYRKQE